MKFVRMVSLIAKDSFCDADGNDDGGFTADEITCLANPFTPDVMDGINCGTLFTALGSTVAAAQNTLITACTGADADGSNSLCTIQDDADVTACLANPFGATCATELGATQAETAQNNLITLCTGAGADGTNALCLTASATATVATCLENPFTTGCDTTLGTKAQADAARDNFIELCTGDGAVGTNPRCTIGEVDSLLRSCLRDPFVVDCDTALGLGATQAMTAQRNILTICTAAG